MIYPNPASAKLTVETGIDSYRDVQISIYNLQGQPVFSKTITQQKTPIDVTWLTGGIYFYELKNGKERIAGGKFVVVR
jgi:hypothetical protein